MKKTLMKTMLIVAFLFCSNQTFAKTNDRLLSAQAEQIIWQSNAYKEAINTHNFVPMLSLQTCENLRTYHCGIKFFKPSHRVPTAKELAYSIQSHPFFIGRLLNELSHDECISLTAKNYPFFIFEVSQSDFYIAHPKGVRHFTINTSHERWNHMASIDNTCKNYRHLESFIKCTLRSHADEHLV